MGTSFNTKIGAGGLSMSSCAVKDRLEILFMVTNISNRLLSFSGKTKLVKSSSPLNSGSSHATNVAMPFDMRCF